MVAVDGATSIMTCKTSVSLLMLPYIQGGKELCLLILSYSLMLPALACLKLLVLYDAQTVMYLV